jgi:superoxide reductase
MEGFGSFFQTGDWENEKHVPIIHAPERVSAGEQFELKMTIGDAVGHPNTFEHYISWFKLMYHPDGAKFPIELASFDFAAHGESDIFTEPAGLTSVKLQKTGTVYAISYCNIHGLWINSQKIEVL